MDQYLAIGSEQGNLPEFRVGIVCDGLLERVCGVAPTFQQFEQLFADGGVCRCLRGGDARSGLDLRAGRADGQGVGGDCDSKFAICGVAPEDAKVMGLY